MSTSAWDQDPPRKTRPWIAFALVALAVVLAFAVAVVLVWPYLTGALVIVAAWKMIMRPAPRVGS